MVDTAQLNPRIPPPPDVLKSYIVCRGTGYAKINGYLGLTQDGFASMEAVVKRLARSLDFSPTLPLESQAPELLTRFWKEINATLPELSKYDDAWPVKALANKYLAYRHSMSRRRLSEAEVSSASARSKSNFTQLKSSKALSYVGKPPPRKVLIPLQPPPVNPPPSTPRFSPYVNVNPLSVLYTPRRPRDARAFQTPSHVSRLATPSTLTANTLPSIQVLPSYLSRRKIGCFSCGHLADCSQQYLTKLSSAFPEPQLDILTQAGVIDDYHFALFLRFSQDERREFFEEVAASHCSRLRSVQLQARCDELDVDTNSNLSSPSAVAVPLAPALSPGAEIAVWGMRCSRCEHKPDSSKVGKLAASFLHSAGLAFLTPAFSILQITTDAEFRELAQLQEQYRSQFFECPDDVVLTTFQKFALKVAFRRHASAN
ncbi:hypothetical protein ONZ45_g13077 [Pleurotus djamor]|nr:hypothetical protein ONZ45_g13077 [Pleurotus djamor]